MGLGIMFGLSAQLGTCISAKRNVRFGSGAVIQPRSAQCLRAKDGVIGLAACADSS